MEPVWCSTFDWNHAHPHSSPIRLSHWVWSSIYGIWFASRRPTIAGRCNCMSASTILASASRGRAPLLLYALEIGPLRREPDPQDPRAKRRKPTWMRIWPTYSVTWERAELHDQGRRTCDSMSSNIIAFSYCFLLLPDIYVVFEVFCIKVTQYHCLRNVPNY